MNFCRCFVSVVDGRIFLVFTAVLSGHVILLNDPGPDTIEMERGGGSSCVCVIVSLK